MYIDLKGFTAFITGGSSGMGFEMARELLSHGATVVIAARGRDRLENARKQLAEQGYDVYAIPMDVRDEQSVDHAARWYAEHFDHLDMLVNNAGVGNNTPGMESENPERPFYHIPVSAFRTIMETNFLGYFLVSRAFVPMMARKGKGRIVNVSTSTSTMTRKGSIPYGPSRAASEAMSVSLSEELWDAGITVNVICPGGVTDTAMTTPAMKAAHQRKQHPILPPDIMNPVILFLASPASEGITGEKIIGKEFEKWLKEKGINYHCESFPITLE